VRESVRAGAAQAMHLLFTAIVDCASDFGFQVPTLHDSVDITVLEQKFARLKAFGQLDSDRRFDRSGACKTDQSSRFGEDQVSQ